MQCGRIFSWYILGSWIILDYICWVELPFHVLLSSSSSSLLWSRWIPPCSFTDDPPPGTLLRTVELSRNNKSTDQHPIRGKSSWLWKTQVLWTFMSRQRTQSTRLKQWNLEKHQIAFSVTATDKLCIPFFFFFFFLIKHFFINYAYKLQIQSPT